MLLNEHINRLVSHYNKLELCCSTSVRVVNVFNHASLCKQTLTNNSPTVLDISITMGGSLSLLYNI